MHLTLQSCLDWCGNAQFCGWSNDPCGDGSIYCEKWDGTCAPLLSACEDLITYELNPGLNVATG